MNAIRLFIFVTLILICHVNGVCQGNFIEVAESVNIDHTYGPGALGGGVSFYDFNNDGWDDLTFATSWDREVHFYLNKSGTFEKIESPISNTYEAKQILWTDFDNDGDADLFVVSLRRNLLYENIGNFTFNNVTAVMGLPLNLQWNFSAAWGDYDRDGWLDLYITDKDQDVEIEERSNHLYRNRKGQFFQEVTLSTNTADSAKAPFAAVFLDIDNDNWQDIYIAQDKNKGNSLLKNSGYDYFYDFAEASNCGIRMDGMCAAVGDYNNDEYLDIYVTNTQDGNTLFRNNTNNTFTEVGDLAGVGLYQVGWGSSFFDYDNDGLLDLYVCNEIGKNGFYKNLDGTYFDSLFSVGFQKDTATSYSNAIGDFNNDGYLDIAVNNSEEFASTLWQNPGDYNNNWLKISLQGVYSNRDGVGSKIVAYCGAETLSRYTHSGIGYLAQNSQYETIGVGQLNIIDSLKVQWLSGLVDTFYDIPVNNTLHVVEGEHSSEMVPKLNISGQYEMCENTALPLNAGYFGDNFKYHWSSGDDTMTNIVTTSGVYFVDIEDLNGNIYRSDTLTVSVLENPVVEVAMVPDFNNKSNGSISLTVTGGVPPYSYFFGENFIETQNEIRNLSAGTYEMWVIDSNGCMTDVSVDIPAVTSVGLGKGEASFTVYPNPTSDYVSIETNMLEKAYVSITDLFGIPFFRTEIHHSTVIDLRGAEDGMYLIRVGSGPFQKLIIKH